MQWPVCFARIWEVLSGIETCGTTCETTFVHTLMNCSRCGHLMDNFDDGCPRCQGYSLAPHPEPPLPHAWPWKRRVRTLVLLVVGCTVFFQGWKWTQQDNIQEAAIRFYAAPPDGSQPSRVPPQILFVRVDDHDPSPGLLARFGSDALKVREFSQGRWEHSDLGPLIARYVDVRDGEKGTTLGLNNLKWHGPFEVEISVDSNVETQIFVLHYQHGRWTGVSKNLTGIA